RREDRVISTSVSTQRTRTTSRWSPSASSRSKASSGPWRPSTSSRCARERRRCRVSRGRSGVHRGNHQLGSVVDRDNNPHLNLATKVGSLPFQATAPAALQGLSEGEFQ